MSFPRATHNKILSRKDEVWREWQPDGLSALAALVSFYILKTHLMKLNKFFWATLFQLRQRQRSCVSVWVCVCVGWVTLKCKESARGMWLYGNGCMKRNVVGWKRSVCGSTSEISSWPDWQLVPSPQTDVAAVTEPRKHSSSIVADEQIIS